MNRLPDTTGIPNEVIMPWHQISGYEHAIRAAGAKVVGVGIPNDINPPYEVYVTTRWDLESAITENTAAISSANQDGSHPPLADIIEVGKKYDVPVILDAADQLPPVENLYKFIDMGADLVCFSGGKGIRGPQAAGILCGRRDLIASAVLQMIDTAGEPFDEWHPPASLIPKDKLRGKPQHGIGRSMKASKEAVIGLLVALQNFTEEKFVKREQHLRRLLTGIGERLEGITGVEMRITEGYYKGGHPMLEINIDEQVAGKNAAAVFQRLKDNEPHIYLGDKYLQRGMLLVNSINLDEDMAGIVSEHLYTALAE